MRKILPKGAGRFMLVLAALVAAAAGWDSLESSARAAAVEPLEIVTATGSHRLRVEVARTQKEREKGLMFRTSLPEDGGMLFDFREERPVAMWMKNTPLSLDMIFVGRDGRVVSLALGAEPYSERIISSGAPALAVIEVSAGVAERLSVSVGDEVRHSMFRR
ncbi:DUF192 domain-containing protein [Methylosinus sp. Sm6]|uniref:DUF192 domain-containing protein n=1 Tax=Methylosinus sp. Sm6 TaxID=2866948 RepID=UPI001C99A548|nr:DUF192 domain-containing protein [Methylosinus sp. Sm6]